MAAADTTLSGVPVPAGAPLVAWIGSANRDERQFQCPAQFDIDRDQIRHLAFGHGIHFCLGAPLARLEARIALEAILSRLPGLEITPEPPLERMDSTIIYGLKSLPASWQVRQPA